MFQLNFVMDHLIWGSDFDCRVAVQQVHAIVPVNTLEINDVLEIQTDKHVSTDKRCQSDMSAVVETCFADNLCFHVLLCQPVRFGLSTSDGKIPAHGWEHFTD